MRAPWLWTLASCLVAHGASADELRVLAFNLLYRGADDAASIRAIAGEGPDVVCLTELTPAFVKAFDASLATTYPYRSFAPAAGTWGVGFASKRPLTRVRTLPVPPLRMPAMSATTLFGGAPVELLCVHLNPPAVRRSAHDSLVTTLSKNDVVRAKQADTLVARYRATSTPVVILGDFNEGAGGAALSKLASAGFSRGCDVAGSACTATFPGPAEPWPAVFEIDHVFARGLSFSNARTVRRGGSDHFPVSATFSSASPAPRPPSAGRRGAPSLEGRGLP